MVRISHAPTPAFRRVMIFIDGGYLRKGLKGMFGHGNIDFTKLANFLVGLVFRGHIQGELVRVFYYDACVDKAENSSEYEKQEQYFNEIRKCDFHEVKLGRLIKTSEGSYRQKGVDVLLAIDMITKAYQGQYDIAILLGGDDDLVDVVKAVKDTGKQIYGVYFTESASKRLIDSFDVRRPLTVQNLDSCVLKT